MIIIVEITKTSQAKKIKILIAINKKFHSTVQHNDNIYNIVCPRAELKYES